MSKYPFSANDLKAFRFETDVKATHVLNELYRHYQLDKVDALFRIIPTHIEQNDFPEFLREYVNATGDLPVWIDHQRIKNAQNLFWSYGREMLLTLLFRSLPMCYICKNGAEVLAATGRLIDKSDSPNYERRLLETLQFVINICSDNEGFEKDGLALSTVKRIRLIHCAIRRFVHENLDWPTEERGEPINMEDELITISAFSIEVIHGLQNMGINLSQEEKEDWCHLWSCTGYLLGVKEELLPKSYSQCLEMRNNILLTQMQSSKAGHELVMSCVEFMGDLLPFHLLYGMSYASIKYLNDKEFHAVMGLTDRHWFWDWFIPKLMKSTLGVDQKLEKHSKIWLFIIKKLNHWLLNGLEKKKLHSGKYFYLPKSLKS